MTAGMSRQAAEPGQRTTRGEAGAVYGKGNVHAEEHALVVDESEFV